MVLEQAQEAVAAVLLRSRFRRAYSPFTTARAYSPFTTAHLAPDDIEFPGRPPVLGVGIGVSEQGDVLELLVPRPTEDGEIESLLAEFRLPSVAFHLTETPRIVAAARPAVGGDSISHQRGPTGTIACMVHDGSGNPLLLSCNHVIANENQGVPGRDVIWQPGRHDGGTATDRLGLLHSFHPLDFSGMVANRIDAALCNPDQTAWIQSGIGALGAIKGVLANAPLKSKVRKQGWATHVTDGKVRIKKLSVIVDFPSGNSALFENQLGIIGSGSQHFAALGDSGALVIDDQNRGVSSSPR